MISSSAKARRRFAWMTLLSFALLVSRSSIQAATSIVEWSATGYAVVENAGTLAVRLTRSGDLSGTSSVQFNTSNGTASSGVDFTRMAGTITFAVGESNQVVNIPLLDNVSPQASRSFSLLLSNFSNAVPGLQSNATVTVLDDETAAVLDPWFDAGLGGNNDIFALGLMPDGRILVGGQFTKWNNMTGVANFIVLQPDGSTAIEFTFPNNTPNAPVYAVASTTNGILIGGDFTSVGGTARSYLARMMSFAGLETNWVPATINNSLRAIIVQPDGKILIAGRFTQVGGQSRNRLARLNADGSLDGTFAPVSGANNAIRSMALQPDGRILIGGQFTDYDGVTRSNIARVLPNGTLDTAFDPGAGADRQVRSVALQADGKILIGGDFETYNGAVRSCVARLFANGALDPDFDTGPSTNDSVRVVAPAAGGKVWVGGGFDFRGGAPRSHLALVNSNGLADPFAADAGFEVDTILVQPDGQTLVAGDFETIIGFPAPRLARLNTGVLFTPAPQVQLFAYEVYVPESVGLAPVRVTRRGDYTVPAAVDYTTAYNPPAVAADYLPTAGRLTFAPLEIEKIIGLPIVNDSLPEPWDPIGFYLTNAPPPSMLGFQTKTLVTIQDDDAGFEFTANIFASSEPEGAAAITVRRGGTGSDTVSVDFIVSSGTAAAGNDFVATNGTLIFQPGETQKTFSVSIVADVLTEGTENALLALTNASLNATIGIRRNATLTIEDVDSVFTWGSYNLGGEAEGYASIVIQRTGNRHLPASVDFIFSNGTAINGIDFTGNNGSISLAPGNDYGQSFGFFTVPILNDGLVEGTESFLMHLANATGGASIGNNSNLIATIQDNDAGIAFTKTNFVVSENSPSVTLTVRRFDDGNEPFTVDYFTSNVTAIAGINYRSQSGTLNVPIATRTNTIIIPLIDQCSLTNGRTFAIILRNPTGGGALGTNSIAAITIRGNDLPGRKDFSLSPLTSDAGPGPIGLAVLPSGEIFGAWPTSYDFYFGAPYASSVIKLREDGSMIPSFNPEIPFPYGNFVFSLCVQHDGRVLAGGVTTYNLAGWLPWLVRMNSNGDRDESFIQPTDLFPQAKTNSENYIVDVSCLIEQPDGRIFVCRDSQADPSYFSESPPRHAGIMRLNSDGSNDASFNAGTGAQYRSYRSGVQAMALQPNGRILLGGLFTNFSELPCSGIVRLETNGALDSSFNTLPAGNQLDLREMKLQADGKILIVGDFTHFVGVPRPGLARLQTNGLLDTSFDPGAISGGTVRKILVQQNGRIVIGGNFTNVQGSARYGLARLNTNGSLDQTFDPTPDQYNVIALALQPDGRILVSDANTGLWRVEGDPIPRVRELSRTNGVVRLHLNSRPGKQYVLEASTNLVSWLPIQTNTAADCALEFTDAASPPSKRFYRAAQLTP